METSHMKSICCTMYSVWFDDGTQYKQLQKTYIAKNVG